MGLMVTAPAREATDRRSDLPLAGAEAEPAAQPTLGVVIPVRNGAGTLGAVLDALAAQTSQGRLHVVVVVNGSRDDTRTVGERGALRLRAAGHTCEVHMTAPGRAGAIRLAEAGSRRVTGSTSIAMRSSAITRWRHLSGLCSPAPMFILPRRGSSSAPQPAASPAPTSEPGQACPTSVSPRSPTASTRSQRRVDAAGRATADSFRRQIRPAAFRSLGAA